MSAATASISNETSATDERKSKSGWDIADILLRASGGFVTALAVAAVGFFGSQFLEHRQAIDTNARLYAELMSKREESDSQLRKDMFKSIIDSFLKPGAVGVGNKDRVLNLELLSYNFHDALDLGPLFKHVYKELTDSKSNDTAELIARMERAATDVKAKQVAALEEGGGKLEGAIDFDRLQQDPAGYEVINGEIKVHSSVPGWDDETRHFRVEALFHDPHKREVRVKLQVSAPQKQSQSGTDVDSVEQVFWVGSFDFPMIDNLRLPHGQRCAVVLQKFQEFSAEITLVYFPAERASLKEKPFYDEVLHNLVTAQRHLDEEKSR